MDKITEILNIINIFPPQTIICILAFSGFMVAWHIHKHKQPNAAPLVCPINFDCHSVVHSDYSRFMNVPVEIFGMIYYGLIFVSYLGLIFVAGPISPLLVILLVVFSTGAFIFSLYLIYIQLFILKKGCLWCFVSAFISILIFILTILIYNLSEAMKIIIK